MNKLATKTFHIYFNPNKLNHLFNKKVILFRALTIAVNDKNLD